jgi:hypothetical protein
MPEIPRSFKNFHKTPQNCFDLIFSEKVVPVTIKVDHLAIDEHSSSSHLIEKFAEPQPFVNSIRNPKNITKLAIFNPNDFIGSVEGVLKLPGLKHLELYNSLKALKFIEAPGLETLQIYGIEKHKKDEDFNNNRECSEFSKILNDFMKKCENLEVRGNF